MFDKQYSDKCLIPRLSIAAQLSFLIVKYPLLVHGEH